MSPHFFPRDEYFMRLALREAERALEHEDVPIGAVIVHDGEVIGTAHNERELRNDPTAHAEMLALHAPEGLDLPEMGVRDPFVLGESATRAQG